MPIVGLCTVPIQRRGDFIYTYCQKWWFLSKRLNKIWGYAPVPRAAFTTRRAPELTLESQTIGT
jgi:hypothetical protein